MHLASPHCVLMVWLLGACASGRDRASERPDSASLRPSATPTSQPLSDSLVGDRRQASGVAVWHGDSLWVRLLTGDSLPFEEVHDEYAPVINRFLGILPSGHAVVQSTYEDGIKVTVIDRTTGSRIELPAPPIASPSGRLIVAGDEMALSDDVLTVWRLGLHGWQPEFSAPHDPTKYWAPRGVRWLDDSTITLTRDFFDSTSVWLLQSRAGRWSLEPRP